MKSVEKFLLNNNLKDIAVILGFSAGPDSVFLADILNKLKEKYNLKIILAYFNHGWRKEAKEEEKFTIATAKKYDFKYIIGTAPKDIKKNEETARELRYSFFSESAEKYKSKYVFLAHNKNDNIETLVYRLIKGTGIKGLNSIPRIRDIYYRPILDITKKEILNYLKENNLKYLIDSSNSDNKHKRNLIRNKILPLFGEINPNYINSIDNLIENSILAKDIIDNSVNKIKNEIINKEKINHTLFLKLKRSLRLEIINDFFKDSLKYRDFKTLNKIDNFILNNQNSKMSLNSNEFLVLKNNQIYISKNKIKNKNELIINSVGTFEFENIILKIEKTIKKDNDFNHSSSNTVFLDFDFPLVLRHRKNGDKFSPFGFKKEKKLKDFLIDNKIEQQKKDELFMLAKNNEICWILGMKINENFKVKNENCYKLTYGKQK